MSHAPKRKRSESKAMTAKRHAYDDDNLAAAEIILSRRAYYEEHHPGLYWNAVVMKERILKERAKEAERGH